MDQISGSDYQEEELVILIQLLMLLGLKPKLDILEQAPVSQDLPFLWDLNLIILFILIEAALWLLMLLLVFGTLQVKSAKQHVLFILAKMMEDAFKRTQVTFAFVRPTPLESTVKTTVYPPAKPWFA